MAGADSTGTLAAAVAAVPGLVGAPTTLAALAAIGVLIAAWGALAPPARLVAQRLGQAVPIAHTLEEAELQRSFHDRVLWPLVLACSRLVLRYTPHSTIEGYRRKLVLAGSPGSLDGGDFLGLKGLFTLGLPAIYAVLSALVLAVPSPLVVIALAGLGFRLPDFWLAKRIKARQLAIQRALPDALDLLTISVEAGLAFDSALQRVTEKWETELAKEFKRVLTDTRLGRARRDALREMVDGPGSRMCRPSSARSSRPSSWASRSARFCVSRPTRCASRRQRAEEAAQKAPIKMLFPMVFLIFPALFVVILGPAYCPASSRC